MSTLLKVKFKVNESPKTVDVDTRDSLLDVLRDSLNLTGRRRVATKLSAGRALSL